MLLDEIENDLTDNRCPASPSAGENFETHLATIVLDEVDTDIVYLRCRVIRLRAANCNLKFAR